MAMDSKMSLASSKALTIAVAAIALASPSVSSFQACGLRVSAQESAPLSSPSLLNFFV